ncbi:GNAT family N-acetyltransferase [Bdellovibrio sp. HCB274]|uniref:GNAT family N-acetyltransferase n=1 Tax=Bdellovibrio sp. HCB274 TaxID=3394361 RepID=UPI0039B6258F
MRILKRNNYHEFNIRRARLEDAAGIHEAHMQSIREVCSKDHSPEEIQGWGNRPFNEENRHNAIKNHCLWVVESDDKIEGYGHLQIYERDGVSLAHVHGLYLTPKALSKNNGRKLVSKMIEEASKAAVVTIKLEATLTAHSFYQKMGFADSAPMKTVEIGGSKVSCYPMTMELNP